eukprot:Lithocolla_globosa_v1_NODE_6595_length_1061_cov_214.957256.p5 type:complete len:126 gc:universal NODE_6595_length_1061_cov_214.957256:584-961(+)
MICKKSSKLTLPSPSASPSLSISANSASSIFSPTASAKAFNSGKPMAPLPFSISLNAALMSASALASPVLRFIMVRKSVKSKVPLLSVSTSAIKSLSSPSVASNSSFLKSEPSWLALTLPTPSLS